MDLGRLRLAGFAGPLVEVIVAPIGRIDHPVARASPLTIELLERCSGAGRQSGHLWIVHHFCWVNRDSAGQSDWP